MNKKKLLSILLVCTLIIGSLSFCAYATDSSLPIMPNSRVASITTDVPGVIHVTTQSNSASSSNMRYVYSIGVEGGLTNIPTVSVTMTPVEGATAVPVPPIPQFWAQIGNHGSAPYTGTATVNNGVASTTIYLHHNFRTERGHCDTYSFNFYQYYPISIGTADPVYIEWSTANTLSGTIKGADDNDFIPESFTLWVENANSILVGNNTVSPDYSVESDGIYNYAYTIQTTNSQQNITVSVNGITYSIVCPQKSTSSVEQGSSPKAVVSYLPIGQFATGNGWGSSNGKFVNKTSLDSTGVSLGSLGGYIEFDFDDPNTPEVEGIIDDPDNPYGVDFVVYGNAFNGNPEAGIVQVGVENNGGVTWYELAGSLYYSGFDVETANTANNKFMHGYSGSLSNANVSYTKNANTISASITKGSTVVNADPFTSLTAWWPEATEGYPVGTAHQDENVTVTYGSSNIDFTGITAVEDSNITNFYAFGYADVTPNGSPAQYGAAVNPYEPNTGSKTGGDGFDLAWAVNIETGLPVDLTGQTVRFVRIYSAVLDNGQFGETSTEICGIFTAVGSGDGESNCSVELVNIDEDEEIETSYMAVQYVDAGEYDLFTEADYMFINDVLVTGGACSLDLTQNSVTRVIAQSGTESPYITYIVCR